MLTMLEGGDANADTRAPSSALPRENNLMMFVIVLASVLAVSLILNLIQLIAH
jgi:hypothetical protein